MKSTIKQVFCKYFAHFGIPENAFTFELSKNEVEEYLSKKGYIEPVLIANFKNCRVNSNYRNTAYENMKLTTLVGLGEYRLVLDIIGIDSNFVSGLEGKICACTNFYFAFEGYKECKIYVEDILYDTYDSHVSKFSVHKTSIGLKMIFPLFRLEKLNSININNIKLNIEERR
ncbi:hypothetical protein [Candidatus Borreliella tachyglossi]|uniref:hypothetical protein n=1 Tax=Candidatus Borreliella tachyglossi TaxID=1964448 RepID=UPI0040427B80